MPSPLGYGLIKALKEIHYFFCFFGLKGFSYISLRHLFCRLNQKNNLASAAKKTRTPIFKITTPQELSNILQRHDADIILASVTHLIQPKELSLAKIGWLNLHLGLLPRYQGINAPFWMLNNREEYVGFTIHFMDEKFDSGPVVVQKQFPNKNISYFATLDMLFTKAFDSYNELLERQDVGKPQNHLQKNRRRSYFSKPSVIDGINYRKKVGKFI